MNLYSVRPPIPVRVVYLPPDTLGLVLNLTGLAVAVLALIIAARAYRKIAAERRTVFELETLRDLIMLLNDGDSVIHEPRLGSLVRCVPEPDLPVLRGLTKIPAERYDTIEGDVEAQVILDRANVPGDTLPAMTFRDRLLNAAVWDIGRSISKRT